MAWKKEFSRLKEGPETLPKNWELKDRLLYYKKRLFIPSNEGLLTEIGQGCQDSKVAGQFGQGKTIELVPRNLHKVKVADWINNYIRSCDECHH